MGEFLAGIALTAFAIFIYKKVMESRNKDRTPPAIPTHVNRGPEDRQSQR